MDTYHLNRRRSSVKTIVLGQICCFCLDLRNGCAIIAIVNLLEGIYSFLMEAWTWNVILAAITSVITGILLLYSTIRNNKLSSSLSIFSSIICTVAFGITAILIFIENHQQSGEENNETKEANVKRDLVGVAFTIMSITQFYFLYITLKFLKELKKGIFNV